MDSEPKEADFNRTVTGGFEKTTHHPSGLIKRERINKDSSRRKIIEDYPDARRSTIALNKDFDPAMAEIYLHTINKHGHGNKVEFLYNEGQVWVTVLNPGKDNLEIHIQKKLDQEGFDTWWDEQNSLIKINYDNEGILEARFQAERIATSAHKDDRNQNWRLTLPILMNYLRSENQGNLEIMRLHSENVEPAVIKNLGLKQDHPMVQEADNIADQLCEQLVNYMSSSDQREAKKLLDSLGISKDLKMRLLIKAKEQNASTIKELIEKNGIDDILNDVIGYWIEDLSNLNIGSAMKILSIQDLTDKGFKWREIELERKKMVAEEVTEGEQNLASYGEEITILDNFFIINRENGNLVVACFSNKGQQRWKAIFPVKIPAKEVLDIFKDPEADFRKIKSLLNFELTI